MKSGVNPPPSAFVAKAHSTKIALSRPRQRLTGTIAYRSDLLTTWACKRGLASDGLTDNVTTVPTAVPPFQREAKVGRGSSPTWRNRSRHWRASRPCCLHLSQVPVQQQTAAGTSGDHSPMNKFAPIAFVLVLDLVQIGAQAPAGEVVQQKDAAVPQVVKLTPAEVAAVMSESDQHFHAAGNGLIKPDDLEQAWTAEFNRLKRVMETIKDAPPYALQATVGRRIAVALTETAKNPNGVGNKGSKEADAWFTYAQGVLADVYAQNMATVLQERAVNLILLGKSEDARKMLEEALKAAQFSFYAGKIQEATIRERLAGVYFSAENWKKALEHAAVADKILTPFVKQPGFNPGSLRAARKYYAYSQYRDHQDAEDAFGRYLVLCGRDISLPDQAEVYEVAGANKYETAQKNWLKAKLAAENLEGDDRAGALTAADKALTVARQTADSYVTRAALIINAAPPDDNNTPLVVNIHVDLGESKALGGQPKQAEEAFLFALAAAKNSKLVGEKHPMLLPGLRRYANLLQNLKRYADAEKQFKRAIDIAVTNNGIGKDSVILIPVYEEYAKLLTLMGRAADAKAKSAEAARIKALPPKEQPTTKN